MQAQRRTLMFLLALTALAAAALALLTCTARRQEAAGREEEAGAIPLSAFAAKELTALTYTRAGQTVSLLYDGGAWAVAGDPDYRLDATKCDAMAAALADLRAIRRLDGAAGEDYGLAEPSLTVTVTAAGRTDTFTFGDTNPVTGDIYLQKAGDDAVYTAAPAKADCFGYSLEELFEPFNPAGITASRLEKIAYTCRAGAERYTVELTALSAPADGGGEAAYQTVWRLAGDPDALLEEEAVQAILTALGGYVTGQTTLAMGADPAACAGCDPVVTVTAADGEKEYALTYAAAADGCRLTVEGDRSVYTVDAAALAAFRPAGQLRAGR